MTKALPKVSRFLGLSVGGAKSDRTAVTVVDFYREQNKAFVIDNHNSISAEAGKTADQVLIELVDSLTGAENFARAMAVDAPLTLPPCILGCDPACRGYEKCSREEVRWMKRTYSRAREKSPRFKHFTPYSQRPVDLYFRCEYPGQDVFQDETLGANLAPQAARMAYLKKFFSALELIEVWPKLTLHVLARQLKLSRQDALSYRNLEKGADVRVRILDILSKKWNLFIYDGDYKKFVSDIASFDSLLCAWVALQWDQGRVVKFSTKLPLHTGWVAIPDGT